MAKRSITKANNHSAIMKIFEVRFTNDEWAALHALAGAMLLDKGFERKEAVEYIGSLTEPNILRQALGLPTRQRGGARAGAGRKNGKRKVKK
jgi:hypothetical protein